MWRAGGGRGRGRKGLIIIRRLRDIIVSEEYKFWKVLSRNTNFNENNIDLDVVGILVTSNLREKIEAEATSLNFLPKGGVLPI